MTTAFLSDPAFIRMALAYSDEAKAAPPDPPMVWLDHAWNDRKPRKKHVFRQPIQNRLRVIWMLPELGQPALRAQDIANTLGLSLRATYRLMASLRPIIVQHNGAGGGYWRKP